MSMVRKGDRRSLGEQAQTWRKRLSTMKLKSTLALKVRKREREKEWPT
jgi:hypothetical protein